MQTILGANGIIATEVAKELHLKYTKKIRLVSRKPKRVNDTDQLFSADLLKEQQTADAVKGSEIVYLTVGIPYNAQLWKEQWPVIMKNVIRACKLHEAKLVFFDNVYMYGPVNGIMTEETPFKPAGTKGMVRAEVTRMLLEEMNQGDLTAVICRSPEFYGPRNTVSTMTATIFDNIKKKKKLQVFVSDSTMRTFIYTPDAGRATALIGNTPDAYDQTWHLPCDTGRLTLRQFIQLVSAKHGKDLEYMVLRKWMIRLIALFHPVVKEITELLYQFDRDYIFDCTKFNKRFPDFETTPVEKGIEEILAEPGYVY